MVNDDIGLARYSAVVTISSGRPGRRSALSEVSRASGVQAFEMSVRNGPAEMVLTRTFGYTEPDRPGFRADREIRRGRN